MSLTLGQIHAALDNIAVAVQATLPSGATIDLHHGNVRDDGHGVEVEMGGAWVRPTQITTVAREIGDKDYLYNERG